MEHWPEMGETFKKGRFSEIYRQLLVYLLTHFGPMFRFHTPGKSRKNLWFLTFSGVIETEH